MSDAHAPSSPESHRFKAALEIFEDALADVRFPDVSADVLRAKASEVEDRVQAVHAARAALAVAEAALVAERADLADLAGRALAYARVYAEGRPELKQRLDSVTRESAEAAPKKRGRPRKRPLDEAHASDAPPPVLPFHDEADEVPETDASAFSSVA